MIFHFHFPHYFTKRVRTEVSELYASSAISNLGLSLVMLFEPIFLHVGVGLSVPQVLWFMAGVYAIYILCIPAGAWLASVLGYRRTLAAAAPLQIGYWLLLAAAVSHPVVLPLAAAAFGLQKAAYWPAFHAVLARYGREQQVGREFGAVNFIVMASHIVGPLIGGFVSQAYGVPATLVVASVVCLCSAIPLLETPERFTPKPYRFQDTLALYRRFPRFAAGYLGFGEELLVLTIWPIFMYAVVKNFGGTGALATASSVAAALFALAMGKLSDQYTKRMLIRVGAGLTAIVWMLRTTVSSVGGVFAADALSQTSKEVAFVPLSALTYVRAEETHILPYAVFFEQSLSVGKLAAAIVGAVLFSLTGSYAVLFFLAALFSLMYTLL